MRGILIGLTLSLLALPVWAQNVGTLDGTWQGSLGVVNGPGISVKTKPFTVRIIITGSSAQVFMFKEDGSLLEVKPGAFHVTRVQSNAVIQAIDSGHDNEGTWVETWDYAVTLKDPNTLIVNWYRVVNNIDLPASSDHKQFVSALAGELSRIQ